MKENIKRIYGLQDLIDQFFCYASEHGCQFIFSQYMLNMEGFVELKTHNQIKGVFQKELYLQRLEDLGCVGYMVTLHQSVGYVPLGNHWGQVIDNLNAELGKDFNVNPNPKAYLRERQKLSMKLIASRKLYPDCPRETPQVKTPEEKPKSTPWWKHLVAVTSGSLVILGLIYTSYQYPSWFQ
jgi:hypothetical protein